MDIKVIVAIITGASLLLTTLFTGVWKVIEIWYKNRIEKQNKSDLKQVSLINLKIDKILYEMLESMEANVVALSKFHNGGRFIDGMSMDKYSMTNEVTKNYQHGSRIPDSQNIFLSAMPDVMYELLFANKYSNPDVESMTKSNFYRNVLLDKGIKSIFLFLIKDLNEAPIGFVTVAYSSKHKIDQDKLGLIWKKHNTLLQLIKTKDTE